MSLSEGDIAQLWQAYVETHSMETLELLMAQYAGLAGYLGRKALAKAPPYQDREDILSFAHHGLLDAIQRFDPNHGVKFETYATRRITGAIIDGQRRQDPLARQARRRVKIVEAALNELADADRLEPSLAEIADRAGMSIEEVRSALMARQSLNASLDAEETDTRGVGSEAEVVAMVAELRARVADRLAGLSARSRVFVLAYYVDEKSMKQVAESLGISPAWCRQTRSNAMSEIQR